MGITSSSKRYDCESVCSDTFLSAGAVFYVQTLRVSLYGDIFMADVVVVVL